MIIHDKFVWLHFPKCAGTKIERLFFKYLGREQNLHQDVASAKADPTISWHDSIKCRSQRDPDFSIENKIIVCSFRRLPAWLQSRFSYEHSRARSTNSSWPNKPELLLKGEFHHLQAGKRHADDVCRKYIPQEILKSRRVKFIRTEYFERDFKRVFGEYIDLSSIPDWEYKQRANTSVNMVPNEIRSQLINGVDALYKNCPYWHAVEKLAYQD